MKYAYTLFLKFSVRCIHPNYLFYSFKCVRRVCPNLSSAPCTLEGALRANCAFIENTPEGPQECEVEMNRQGPWVPKLRLKRSDPSFLKWRTEGALRAKSENEPKGPRVRGLPGAGLRGEGWTLLLSLLCHRLTGSLLHPTPSIFLPWIRSPYGTVMFWSTEFGSVP